MTHPTPSQLTEIPLQAVQIICSCPHCKKGEMKVTGFAQMTHPQQFQHQCDNENCGYTDNYPRKFPLIGHKEMPNDLIACPEPSPIVPQNEDLSPYDPTPKPDPRRDSGGPMEVRKGPESVPLPDDPTSPAVWTDGKDRSRVDPD